MKKTPYILTQTGLTVIIEGRSYSMDKTHPKYGEAIYLLKSGKADEIKNLFNVKERAFRFVGKKLKLVRGQFTFNGEPLVHPICEKILSFVQDGLPALPLIKFLENLLANPSFKARQRLNNYVEKYSFPISDDGCFFAYKAVRSDFLDKFSGKISNKPGATVSMERKNVDDNGENGCSFGLHVGNFDYVRNYGSGEDKFILVKVNPADVVSCPNDSSFQKIRVCKYYVVKEVSKDEVVQFTKHYQND